MTCSFVQMFILLCPWLNPLTGKIVFVFRPWKLTQTTGLLKSFKMGYITGFILNFWLRYGHFNIIQFYITKGYLVTFYNTNIGKKKPRLVRWNPWVENIYGARWYPTTRTYARFEPCGSAAGYPYVPGRYMSSFFRSWFSIRNHEFLGLSNLFTGFKKKLNIFRYICQGTVTGSTAATYCGIL